MVLQDGGGVAPGGCVPPVLVVVVVLHAGGCVDAGGCCFGCVDGAGKKKFKRPPNCGIEITKQQLLQGVIP